VVLEGRVRLGRGVTVGAGSVLGSAPQDTKYAGEETVVEIGDGTVVREYVTVNRGTAASGATAIGRDCFLMTYVHVAHDCRIGDGVTIANATQLSGHVTVEDGASLSGLIAVHQFVTIGTHAFIGGASRIPQDIPPYVKAVGNPVKLYGLNTIGLQRAGFSPESIGALKRAYRLLFNSSMPRAEALDTLESEADRVPEVRRLAEFISSARRGTPA
jgi:UDP-N-acetylglucosamine acyltransferase